MPAPLLSIRGVRCRREGRTLFQDLDLEVHAGECVSLTGPNGSGKTTLLRCVNGLYPDYEGTIEVAGFAYLGHRPGVSLPLSPLENLRWYANLAGAERVPGTDELVTTLERVGLAGFEDLPCQRLSAGQQRRVGLARLMLDGSPLWLLDEPFTALDVEGQALVRSLLVGHARHGGAALCATHQDLEVPGGTEIRLGRARGG